MKPYSVKFSLNHMVCPRWEPQQLIETAAEIGVGAVELRNDIGKNSILDIGAARSAGRRAKELGIEVLSINALYPFNIWNEECARKALKLAQLVDAAGGHGLVLCPLMDAEDDASALDNRLRLEQALLKLDVILGDYDLYGFIEPLGFPMSSLRNKAEAVAAIQSLGLESRFGLVHDTFHHQTSGEKNFFATHTGIVHISGVKDPSISFENMLDHHRFLVDKDDRLGNISQLRRLLANGYDGYVSFEPFSESVHALADPVAALCDSMSFVQSGLQC